MSPADFFLAGFFVALGALAAPFAMIAVVWCVAFIFTIIKVAIRAARGPRG